MLEESLQELRGAIKGLLGQYHLKLLYDYLVATKLLPLGGSLRIP